MKDFTHAMPSVYTVPERNATLVLSHIESVSITPDGIAEIVMSSGTVYQDSAANGRYLRDLLAGKPLE